MRFTITIVFAILFAAASANVSPAEAYAYPVPWVPAEGPLTLHYESGWNSSPPTFIVVDTLGEEVIRLVGARVSGGRAEGVYDGYPEMVVFEAEWDGCNAGGRPVNAGTYLCFVRGSIFRFIVVR
ncbi:MAG: hypothetical protein NTW26_09760 [bacterium]|nr:hypothetical protein [bacterium]